MIYACFQVLFLIWLICFVVVPAFLCARHWCENNLPEPTLDWFAWLRKWTTR